MIRAGVGLSQAANPKTAAFEAAGSALANAGLSRAEGALCFITSAHGAAYPMILRAVAQEAGTKEVVGCSGAGVIGGQREIESGPAVSVIVFGGGSIGAKRLFTPTLRGRPAEAARELAAAVRPLPNRDNLLCLLPDSYNFDAEPFLAVLRRELPDVAIVGGGATEDGSIGETFQFCGDAISSNSVAGMLLSGDFEVNIASTLACAPIGVPHRVTAARDNIILELDGRSAFEVFSQAIGRLADDFRRAQTFVFLAVPEDASAGRLDRGRFFVRNILGVSAEHGAIAVAHRPNTGDVVGIALRDGARAREDLKATLEALGARLAAPPAFGLYFDCVSRGNSLYGIPDHDSAYIRQYLGEVPIAGFFTGFELGPMRGEAALLQYSGVLALVSSR